MKNQEEEIIEYKKWRKEYKHQTDDRIAVINYLIQKFNYKRYLEIGILSGYCFEKIIIEHKDGVDPNSYPFVNYVMTSDEFFNQLKKDYKYDIIFIDGLHYDYQIYIDINNALDHLSHNGIILCHDMNPIFEIFQEKKPIVTCWTGDCWKAFIKLRSERNDLEMFVINIDFGVGLIRKGKQEIINIPEKLNYEFLDKNRKNILNLITLEDFYKKI